MGPSARGFPNPARLEEPKSRADVVVIAEPQRALSGTQFEGILFQFAHYNVPLWVPELGGPVDIENDGHYMALSNYGTMSRAERNRTRLRVGNAMRAQAKAGRWLGGRPPYGYRIGDLGPHPNPSKAASGALHQLEVDPETAPVVRRIYDMYLAGSGYKQIATVLTNEAIPCPSVHDRARNSHRPGHAWAMSVVRTILNNPRYLGRHVSGRTRKVDVLLDPDMPSLGHVTRQKWQHRADWVTASTPTYEPIVDEMTWHRVQALIVSKARPDTAKLRPTHAGMRRSDLSLSPRRIGGLRRLRKEAPGQHGPWPCAIPLQDERRLPAADERASSKPLCTRGPVAPPR